MQIDVVVAKIVLSILDFGKISDDCLEISLEMLETLDHRLAFFNAIFISHKQRFERCFTDALRDSEMQNFIEDYSMLFGDSFIDVDLVLEIFGFAVIGDVYSTRFSECCAKLIRLNSECNIIEFKYAILSRIISMIVRCRIYGREPIDTYLRECVDEVDRLHLEYGDIKQISLLE